MSDLLSRLIQRASGTPSPVEPVLGSRYEPQGSFVPASLPLEETANTKAKKSETAPVVLPPQRLESIRTVAAEPQPAAERPHDEPVSRPTRAAHPVSPPIESPAARELVIERMLPAVSEIESREVRIEVDRSTANLPAEPRIAERKPATVSLAPRSDVRSEPIGVEALQSPDIEVSIGHIELRMVAPARPALQPQARPRHANPRLTLDEYLRRRNGGGR
jgi:hypothetical protein